MNVAFRRYRVALIFLQFPDFVAACRQALDDGATVKALIDVVNAVGQEIGMSTPLSIG